MEFHFYGKVYATSGDDDQEEDQERIDGGDNGSEWPQKDPQEFQIARRGDHLMTPFQCDHCVFFLLTGMKYREATSATHQVVKAAIRRVILDSFWSRASETVKRNARAMASTLETAESHGLRPPLGAPLRIPDYDHSGYFEAVTMVLKSRQAGRHSRHYTQWDTIRKTGTIFRNYEQTVSHFEKDYHGVTTEKGMYLRFAGESTTSWWFNLFSRGCKARMGQDWRPNTALSTKLLLRVLSVGEELCDAGTEFESTADTLTACAYFAFCYGASLRGPEGLLINLETLKDQPGMVQIRSQLDDGDVRPFFLLPLRGKVKGETHVRDHLWPLVEVTSSGLRLRDWADRLLSVRELCGQQRGPAICFSDGRPMTASFLTSVLHKLLVLIFEKEPELFPPSIKEADDITESVGVFRTLRRTSNGRANSRKVSESDKNTVNRWSSVERRKGQRPGFPTMSQYYSDVVQIIPAFLRYSFAM